MANRACWEVGRAAAALEGKYPYNQQETPTEHHWEHHCEHHWGYRWEHHWDGVDDNPTFVNFEAEEVGGGGRGWDKEHDEWRMLLEIEAGEEAHERVKEHEMLKV